MEDIEVTNRNEIGILHISADGLRATADAMGEHGCEGTVPLKCFLCDYGSFRTFGVVLEGKSITQDDGEGNEETVPAPGEISTLV